VKDWDRETGEEIPYRGYDRRSFAIPIKARLLAEAAGEAR
jgi:hypothetical protein